jgi:hypothetical protein
MASLPVMGPAHVKGSYTSTRPPTFGDPTNENYPSFRRDVELWLKLTEVAPERQGVALVGTLSGEPKEFAKTLPDELLFSSNSGMNVIKHLDKAYLDSTEMILNTRVSNFLDYQRLPTMSVSTYVAGFYARLDNLTQLQMPDELKGHLLLKQANLEQSEKAMVIASAKGSYKISAVVDSMRQLYGERQDVPVASPSFLTSPKEKKLCGYCKKKNHNEKDCWKKRKAQKDHSAVFGNQSADVPTFVSFVTSGDEVLSRAGLIDSGAVHTIIGKSTLNDMMAALNISKIEKCQTLSPVHRFGTHGTPIESDFGLIIPWSARDIEGKFHTFNIRADVLEGDHPFLIGCPTLTSMKASLNFSEAELNVNISNKCCCFKLRKQGNHLFIEHNSSGTAKVSHIEPEHEHNYIKSYYGYENERLTLSQFFQQPGHC